MQIKLGDVYWIKFENEITHPYLVLHLNLNENKDKILVCRITTNQNKASLPGNVILEPGEGNLEKQSIIEVAHAIEVETPQLGDYIGALDKSRVDQAVSGIKFLQRTYFSQNKL